MSRTKGHLLSGRGTSRSSTDAGLSRIEIMSVKAAARTALAAGMTRAADRPARTQMRLQVLLQDAPGLDEQAAIDGLVRHLTARPLAHDGAVLHCQGFMTWRMRVFSWSAALLAALFALFVQIARYE